MVINYKNISPRCFTASFIDKALSETEEIVLRHHENMFTFEFAALSYFHPEKNQYAYRLEGFNSDWMYVDGTSRKATYTNLDPGDYFFRVKASNNDGVWNDKGTSIKIKIKPPFWKTWWFKLGGLIILALAIYGIIEYRTYEIKKQRMKLETLVEERDNETGEILEYRKLFVLKI